MKQRVLVMNGQRLLQNELLGKWVVVKVEKASSLRPGIYNIYGAEDANRVSRHSGPILHANERFVYQKVKSSIVRHPIGEFKCFPKIGEDVEISYSENGIIIASEGRVRDTHRVRR